MYRFIRVGLIVSFTHFTVCALLAASVTNGGFEDGVADWPGIGNTGAAGTYLAVDPPAGVSQGLITSNGGTSDQGQLNAFLGVPGPSGQFPGTVLQTLRDGTGNQSIQLLDSSALSKVISGNAGDSLSFLWCYITEEQLPESGYDAAIFTLARMDGTVLSASVLTHNFRYDDKYYYRPNIFTTAYRTDYTSFNYVLPQAGNFRLGLTVVNGSGTTLASHLLLDSVAVSPEPAALSFVGIALFATLRPRSSRR